MNTALWILQSIIALIFLYSGISKIIFSERELVSRGLKGVEGLPLPLIRFAGISEITGAIGIVLPSLINILPQLTAVSAICLSLIMIPATIIHIKRSEYKNVAFILIIFTGCILIAFERFLPVNG